MPSTLNQGSGPEPEVPAIAGLAPATLPPPFRVAQADQGTTLSVALLRHSNECRTVSLGEDKLMVKYDPCRTYLTLTPAQWRALALFGPGRTVPQVLFQLIEDRGCIPLREFYEVVVKALQAGVLQTEGHPVPPRCVPAAWRLQLTGRWVRLAAIVLMVGALVALIVRPMQLPTNVLHLLGGWGIACAAASLGYWLGAGVTRASNAEVYGAEFRWKTLCPHFHADLHDAIMSGPQAVIDVGLARLAPTFLALGIAAFASPGLVLPLFCAVLFLLSPFWWSPGLVVAHAYYGAPRNDATWHFRFEPNKAIWYAFTTRVKHTNLRFIGIHSLYGTVWLSLVVLAASLLLRANASDLWNEYVASRGLHFTALAVLAVLVLAVVGVLGTFAWVGALVLREWWRERSLHRVRPRRAALTPEAVQDLIGQSLLFKHLPDADRAAIAGAAQPEEYPRGAMILREGDEGNKLYVLFSGTVEVLHELPSGRQDPVATLAPGDVFGEIALLNACRRTRSVRALEKTIVLSLSHDDFRTLVLSKLSRQQVEDTIQKIGFLNRIPLACTWSPHAMTAFSRRANFEDFPEGGFVIREGEDNQFFYVLYEGELAVRRLRNDIAQLHPGDFFGEISLLQNSLAKATIVARTPVRCLVMNKRDFLQFLSKDFIVGLQFEAISSKRLGEPLFPLKGKSFDVLRG